MENNCNNCNATGDFSWFGCHIFAVFLKWLTVFFLTDWLFPGKVDRKNEDGFREMVFILLPLLSE